MKKVFITLMSCLMALGSSAAELDIMPNYSADLCWSGASMSGNTATWQEAWGGLVFNLENKDYSAYDYVVVDFAEPTTSKLKVEAYYSDSNTAGNYCEVEAGAKQVKLDLDASQKSNIQKIAIMSAKAASATITKAVLTDEFTVDPVLWEGEFEIVNMNTSNFTIKNDKFAALKSGDKLTVYFTVGSNANYGTIQLCYGWTKMTCDATRTNTKPDGNYAADATETSVVIEDAADIDGLKKSGLRIKGKNVTIKKVVLTSDGLQPQPPTPDEPENPDEGDDNPGQDSSEIWSGSTDTGKWANDITVEAAKFRNVKGGDILTVKLNVNAGADYGNIELDDQKYTKLELDGSSADLDSYGCVQPDVVSLTYTITDSDAALLKANGLRVKGANITVTGILLTTGEGGNTPSEDTTVWSGSTDTGKWTNDITVEAAKFRNVKGGDLLTVKLNVNAGADYGNIELDDQKYTKLELDGSSADLDSYGCVQPDVVSLTYTITDSDAALLKANGLRVKGANITVTGILLTTGEGGNTPSEDTTVWSGSTDTGKWANDVTVDAPKFAHAKGGDIITISLSVNAGSDYGNIELDDQNYVKLAMDGTSAGLDSYGCVQPDVTELSYTIANSDIELLKANGLRVKGANITITKITLSTGEALPDDPQPADVETIWTGNVNCGQWKQTVEVAADKFVKANAGDKLSISLTRNAGKGTGTPEVQAQNGTVLACNGKGTNLDGSGNLVKGASEVTYTLDENDLYLLRTHGLRIRGFAVTITKVSLKYMASTSIDDVASEQDAPIEYYTLQGMRVDNPTTGIYIKRRGKNVSKVFIR